MLSHVTPTHAPEALFRGHPSQALDLGCRPVERGSDVHVHGDRVRAGFTIIAIGCGIIAYLLVHESRAWRHLVWDVLHATGITDTQHKTLRDLVRRLFADGARFDPVLVELGPLVLFEGEALWCTLHIEVHRVLLVCFVRV